MAAFGIPPSRRVGDLKRALEAAVEAGEVPPTSSATPTSPSSAPTRPASASERRYRERGATTGARSGLVNIRRISAVAGDPERVALRLVDAAVERATGG